MKVRSLKTLVVFLIFGILASPVALAADGKAEGTVTVNGKTTKLSYAYAKAVEGFFDKTKKDVEVILSDVPLSAKLRDDVFELMRMKDAGKLHTFEITLNAEGTPISTSWKHNGFKPPSPSGLSSADVFTKKTFDGKTVDGRYKSAKEKEFFGNTYSFDVAFRADITR
jgi:hypothetical protein